MNLYLLKQDANYNYDTYDSLVVAANSVEDARMITPDAVPWSGSTWVKDPKDVKVEFIGVAAPQTVRGIVLGSYNAG